MSEHGYYAGGNLALEHERCMGDRGGCRFRHALVSIVVQSVKKLKEDLSGD